MLCRCAGVLKFPRCSKNRNRFTVFTILVSQFFMSANTFAGPPLVIDDPGILDPGAWEVIFGYSIEDRPAAKIKQAPSLDVSFGVSPNSQVSVFVPRVVETDQSGEKKSGLGFAAVGYKYRMLSTPAWELALAANYHFLVSHKLYPANGPDDVKALSLPVLASYTHEDWTWFAQLGWNIDNDGAQFWDYGLAVSHPLGSSVQLMVEAYGYSESAFDIGELHYQLGVDVELTPAFHLLSSVGSSIKSGFEPAYHLDYSFYVGLQWFPGE